MNLIDRLAELQKLEAKATPGPWYMSIAEGYERIWRFIRCDPPQDRPEDTYIAGTLGRRKDGLLVALTGKRIIEEADNDARMIAELRNSAPELLDILGEIRPGDADALEEIADILEEAGFVAKAAYVRRYQAMAAKMETENK